MRITAEIWKLLLLAVLAISVLLSVYLFLHFRIPALLALPFGLVLVMQVLYDYRPLYYLLFFAIPCSIPVTLGGSLSTDLGSEQLMWLFMLIFVLNLFSGKHMALRSRIYAFHVFVFLIFFWIIFTTVTSEFPLRSLKFAIAKFWYLAAFVLMGESIMLDSRITKKIILAFMIPLSILAAVTTVRHGLHAFSFEWSNFVMQPYFFNHVIYGAVVALFLPFAFYSTQWFRKKSFAWYFSWFSTGMLFIGAVLSYGRAAWVCVLVMPVIVFLVRRKLFERLVYVALVAGALMVGFLLKDNAFYQFAPEYKSTVFHSGDLEGHLSATFEGSEISSMERFYRWVAAKNMIAARPIIGFGPSTFNQVYKRYADDAFRTYVSDNPEQSTTHNYFLMTFAEQGFVGGLLFLSFCIYMLIRAYRTYHVVRKTEHKNLVMAALLSLSVILLHCLLNELIEVDKVGSMFWFSMVLIHKVQVWHEEENGKPAENAF